MYMCPIWNGLHDGVYYFTVAKLLIKCYYVLFLISVFIVQVTKLVQFTQYNTFSRTHVTTCWFPRLRAS
jgi:hypothetical protein